MFTKSKLFNMNNDRKYSSFGWIKNLDSNMDDNKLYKLYPLKSSSITNGREYIALPSDKILTNNDYLKYNIMK
jgi:hypothetical protein